MMKLGPAHNGASPVRSAGRMGRQGLCAVLLCTPVWSQAVILELRCPAQLEPQGLKRTVELPAGFVEGAAEPARAHLVGVSVFDGPQAGARELQALRPATTNGRREDVTRPGAMPEKRWRLRDAPQGAVLACRYDGGVWLARLLPAELSECRATLERRPARDEEAWRLDGAQVVCR